MKATIFILFLLFTSINSQSTSSLERESRSDNNHFVVLGINDSHTGIVENIKYKVRFNHNSSSFRGTLENIGSEKQSIVILRIFLSNGARLGPERIIDILPAEKKKIVIKDENNTFNWWTFHITFQEGQKVQIVGQISTKGEENSKESSSIDNKKQFTNDKNLEPNKANIREAEPVMKSIHKGERSKDDIKNAKKSTNDIDNE